MKHTLVNTPEKGFSLEATEDIKDPLSPAKPSLIIDLAAKTVDIFHHWHQKPFKVLRLLCLWQESRTKCE